MSLWSKDSMPDVLKNLIDAINRVNQHQLSTPITFN